MRTLQTTGITPQVLASMRPDLRNVCERYHIRRLGVFGSTANGTRKNDSDIDLLVEFQTGKTPGFLYSRIADELTMVLGLPVDLHTIASISRYFRQQVVSEAKLLYAEEE
jgi:uncharacterized protein